MFNLQKKYIYIIACIVGLLFAFGCYNLIRYKYVIYKTNKIHQASTKKVSTLKTKEKQLEFKKEELDKQVMPTPTQDKIIDFFNELGPKT